MDTNSQRPLFPEETGSEEDNLTSMNGENGKAYCAGGGNCVDSNGESETQKETKNMTSKSLDSSTSKHRSEILMLLQASMPTHRLETITPSGYFRMILLFLVFLILAVIDSIVYSQMISNLAPGGNESLNFMEGVLKFQLSIHFLANITLVFLFISYPQRICVRLYHDGIIPTPEQLILVLTIITLLIIPLFSFGTLICNYLGTTEFLDNVCDPEIDDSGNCTFTIEGTTASTNETAIIAYVYYTAQVYECEESNPGQITFNRVMTTYYLGYFALFLVFMSRTPWFPLRYEGQVAGLTRHGAKLKSQKHTKMDNSRDSNLNETAKENYPTERNDDTDDEEESTQNYGRLESLAHSASKCLLNSFIYRSITFVYHVIQDSFERSHSKEKGSGRAWFLTKTSFKLLRPGFSSLIVFSVLFYVTYLWTVSAVYDVFPSLVPIVQIISIWKVCFLRFPDGTSANYCAPGTLAHQRACAMGFLAVYEIYLFIVLPVYFMNKATKKLSKLPYHRYRSKHLGFRFYQVITILSSFCLGAISISLMFVQPAWVWIVSSLEIEDDTIIALTDPLFVVGVTANSACFVSFYVILVAWLTFLCLVYLPEDSAGLSGWFCSSRVLDKEDRSSCCSTNLNDSRFFERGRERVPLYLVFEKEVQVVAALRLRQPRLNSYVNDHRRQVSFTGNQLIHETQSENLTRVKGNEHLPRYNSEHALSLPQSTGLRVNDVFSMIDGNVFVMEFSVLLFNFAFAVYCLDPEKQLKENETVIHDKKYKLQAYVFDEKTDTHVLVASSRDRIVVAFRGTASKENLKTDLDFSLTEYDFAQTAAEEWPRYNHQQGEKFYVHRGFLEVLSSVRDSIMYKIKELLAVNPSLSICFTGHSLGGGLAVLCAFETKIALKSCAVAVITFGGPKIGSKNMIALYNEIVPYTYRFVLIRDIIPALRSPKGESYYHVGVEITLDLYGNMIFSPNFIERHLLLQVRRHTASNHFMSRYALSLMLWNIAVHLGDYTPDFWLPVKNKVLRTCRYIINPLDPVLKATVMEQLRVEGVVFRGKHKINLRDIGVETDNEVADPGSDNAKFVNALNDIIQNHDGTGEESVLLLELENLRDELQAKLV